jgi:DNA-binding CsgD family transcriptional regulator
MPIQNELTVGQLTNSPYGGHSERSKDEQEMALLALSHTPLEHQVYWAMLREVTANQTRIGAFSARVLMMLTGLNSFSAIRRARAGLIRKLSIEHHRVAGESNPPHQHKSVYIVFKPEEIFARRRVANLAPYPQVAGAHEGKRTFGQVIGRILERHSLSRREAQVALCCAEGLTNAQIGKRLSISEKTVKFHLRHIFIKFGVKRRAELLSFFLM